MSIRKKLEYADTLVCSSVKTETTLQEIDLVYAQQHEVQIGTALNMPSWGLCLVVDKKGPFVELLTINADFQTFNSHYILKGWLVD